MLNTIIKQLLLVNIPVELVYDESTDSIGYAIGGFYKSDRATLYQRDDDIEALTRYNTITPIDSLEDLINLNIDWWESSKDRYSGWASMDMRWTKLKEQL